MATDTQVSISAIQRMYSLLKGEELDEAAEESPLSGPNLLNKTPLRERFGVDTKNSAMISRIIKQAIEA